MLLDNIVILYQLMFSNPHVLQLPILNMCVYIIMYLREFWGKSANCETLCIAIAEILTNFDGTKEIIRT